MNKVKVFLTGGDNSNWALDTDLRQTKQAIELLKNVELTNLSKADVIHTMWWSGLQHLPADQMIGKRIISHMAGEPLRYFQSEEYSKYAKLVGLWLGQSNQAKSQLDELNMRNMLVPYTVDDEIFQPLIIDDNVLHNLRQKWQIPTDRYLIGNFHRDTRLDDLSRPKLVKGPDIFLEIILGLANQNLPIHVVLAGPRRHWLRSQLLAHNIPFSFVGQVSEKDDNNFNILPPEDLNILYNLIDVYVISSRSEGGPRSVMEAAAAGCKVISTPVGLARDILHPSSIFDVAPVGVELLMADIANDFLEPTVEHQKQVVLDHHRPTSILPALTKLYESIDQVSVYQPSAKQTSDIRNLKQMTAKIKLMAQPIKQSGFIRNTWRKVIRPSIKTGQRTWQTIQYKLARDRNKITVCLWHEYKKPPYGGGNQFMIALRKKLLAHGINVVENQFDPAIDVYLLNSIHFDVEAFLKFKQSHSAKVVHRIDGPIHLIRGTDKEKDELCYKLNAEFASATIIQSNYTLKRIIEFGYQPVNPVVINNGVDPDIFHPTGRTSFDPERKIRLVSSSWSDSPINGGPIYKWIEDNLDWDRYDYTFVGRASEKFDRIKQIKPVPSNELAMELRKHDIYITASQNDPCSNALIEAMACGSPALYFDSGGHPELVSHGGLPFSSTKEIMPQLERIVANYQIFQNLITISRLDDVVHKYLTTLRNIL
jgi:glycosyltransferase involved in cell wall biosynthesis